MNSHSNSPEFNFCSDEDYSVENSILFCESKKSLLDAVSSEISKNQNFEKNNGAKPKKFRKKKKARKQKIFKNEEKSPEIEKEVILMIKITFFFSFFSLNSFLYCIQTLRISYFK